jgi:hypothetical protein
MNKRISLIFDLLIALIVGIELVDFWNMITYIAAQYLIMRGLGFEIPVKKKTGSLQ